MTRDITHVVICCPANDSSPILRYYASDMGGETVQVADRQIIRQALRLPARPAIWRPRLSAQAATPVSMLVHGYRDTNRLFNKIKPTISRSVAHEPETVATSSGYSRRRTESRDTATVRDGESSGCLPRISRDRHQGTACPRSHTHEMNITAVPYKVHCVHFRPLIPRQ